MLTLSNDLLEIDSYHSLVRLYQALLYT